MTAHLIESRPPRVLVLDDEPVQRMTVRLQLPEGIEYIDFGEPGPALEYILGHDVDAAVIDLMMPGMPNDGAWFLRELRKRDRNLAVVLRTADDSVEAAEIGIEARAVRRVVKSAPDAKVRLREAVATAIAETRDRRRLLAIANEAGMVHEQLANMAGRADGEITSGELCRGFVHDLVNHAAAVAGYAELLSQLPTVDERELRQLAEQNRAAASELTDKLNEFVQTPYFDRGVTASTANQCLDALAGVFRTHPLLAGVRPLNCRGILPDVAFMGNPHRVLIALRHLVEYCAMHSGAREPILAYAALCDNPANELSLQPQALVANAEFARTRPGLVLAVRAKLRSDASIVRDLSIAPADSLAGNLVAAAKILRDERISLGLVPAKSGVVTFNCHLQVAT